MTLASAVEPTTAERQAVAMKARVRAGALFPMILKLGSMSTELGIVETVKYLVRRDI